MSQYYIELMYQPTNTLLWRVDNDNRDYIAGIVAMTRILVDSNHYIVDNIELGSYIVRSDIKESNIKDINISVDLITMCLRSTNLNDITYDMYEFSSVSFINGLMDTTLKYEVSLNDYVAGLTSDELDENSTKEHTIIEEEEEDEMDESNPYDIDVIQHTRKAA